MLTAKGPIEAAHFAAGLSLRSAAEIVPTKFKPLPVFVDGLAAKERLPQHRKHFGGPPPSDGLFRLVSAQTTSVWGPRSPTLGKVCSRLGLLTWGLVESLDSTLNSESRSACRLNKAAPASFAGAAAFAFGMPFRQLACFSGHSERRTGGPAVVSRKRRAGTFGPARRRMATTRGSPMDRAVAYAISTIIVLFGVWIIAAGLSSSSPVLWIVVGLVPVVIGLVSALGPT